MKKALLLLSLALLLSSVHGQDDNHVLVWSDEFEYTGLPDPEKWGYDVGRGNWGWGNNEDQFYTEADLDNARVENGNLIIEATLTISDRGARLYESARLVTRDIADWVYGRFEARMKMPFGRGTWPAFWMLPTDSPYGGWPDGGEIDIMEHVGFDMNKIHGTIHTGLYNWGVGTSIGGSLTVPDVDSEFYTYAVEWHPGRLDFYVDDILYQTYLNDGLGSGSWPFDVPFHLILNLAIGGTWGGQQGVDESIFPQRMEVDYVRVYEILDMDQKFIHDIPATIESSNLMGNLGARLEPAWDQNGEDNVTMLEGGDYVDFGMRSAAGGNYSIAMRYATRNAGVEATVTIGDGTPQPVTLPATSRSDPWLTANLGEFTLPAGVSTMRFAIDSAASDFEIDEIIVTSVGSGGDTWAGFPVSDGIIAATGAFLGDLYIVGDPWHYSFALDGWVFLPEENVSNGGAWVYILN